MPLFRAALLPALMMALAACGSSSALPPQAATAPAATASPLPVAETTAIAAATASPLPTAAAQAAQATATASPVTAAAPTATLPALVLATASTRPTAVAQLTATPVAPAAQAPAATSAPVAGASSPHVQQAVADLAARLSVDPGTISVLRAEEVEWPDGSLGCPRDDMSYTQALVNGVFVQLAAGGQSYNYHGRSGDEPFLCSSPDEVLPEDLPPELRGGGGADT